MWQESSAKNKLLTKKEETNEHAKHFIPRKNL
jgi:hypothetical protein